MPVCEMCTASYDDTFKFCPNCGRAKPEPKVTRIDVRVTDAPYEEATMEIEQLGKRPVSEPPFDWRPNIMHKALRDAGHNWQEIGTYQFALHANHPTKGTYIAFRSSTFRAFQRARPGELFELPIVVKNRLVYQPEGRAWLQRFFLERREAWEGFNQYLIGDGWRGITQAATNRKPPLKVEFDLSLSGGIFDQVKVEERQIVDLHCDGFLSIGQWWSSVQGQAPDYRYQRPAR